MGIVLRLSDPELFDAVRDGLPEWTWSHPKDDERFLNIWPANDATLDAALTDLTTLVSSLDPATLERWRSAEPALDHSGRIYSDEVASELRLSVAQLAALSALGVQFWSSVYCCSEPSPAGRKAAP